MIISNFNPDVAKKALGRWNGVVWVRCSANDKCRPMSSQMACLYIDNVGLGCDLELDGERLVLTINGYFDL